MPGGFRTPGMESVRTGMISGERGEQNTTLKQADEMMFPGSKDTALSLLLKSRGAPDMEGEDNYTLAEGLADGSVVFSEIKLPNADYTVYQYIAARINSYSHAGESRKEMTSVLSSLAGFARRASRRFFGRGNAYDGDGYE